MGWDWHAYKILTPHPTLKSRSTLKAGIVLVRVTCFICSPGQSWSQSWQVTRPSVRLQAPYHTIWEERHILNWEHMRALMLSNVQCWVRTPITAGERSFSRNVQPWSSALFRQSDTTDKLRGVLLVVPIGLELSRKKPTLVWERKPCCLASPGPTGAANPGQVSPALSPRCFASETAAANA
jgi:hypothetical protein